MSAICAIFCADGVSDEDVQIMMQGIQEFPHDDAGTWRSQTMALGASLIHTTSESRVQQQPMASQDGALAAIFDGHLANHAELASALEAKGVQLRNRSDVEIALRAFETWGDECADRLHGEFAFVVADLRQGRLFAALDHMGFIPLFFRQEGKRLILASDFRSIAALGKNTLEPNPRYLAQIITNRWYLRDETPWRDVGRVRRAHLFSFDGETVTQTRYWTPPTEVSIRYESLAEYAEHYREVLFDCVRRSCRSDRDVGIAVSGGLDSSAIFAVADDLERRGELPAPGIRGYTLAAEPGSNAFELPYARAAAAHLGRTLTEVPLFDPDIDWYSEDAEWHNDLATPSNGAMMLTMEQRAYMDGSRVFLNGNGGDQWLQGHKHSYVEFLDDRDVKGFLRTFRSEVERSGMPKAARQCVHQTSAWLAPVPLRSALRRKRRASGRQRDVALNWLVPELRDALADAQEAYEATLPEGPLEWAKTNLATTPRADMSFNFMRRQRNRIGVDSRQPMYSRAFMEFSLRTPAHIKRRGALTKVTHREAMQSLLPDKVLNRTTKANFTNTKIDGQFADYVRRHASSRLGPVCDAKKLNSLLDIDFSTPEGDYWAWEIWGLYASAAFLYQHQRITEINPATGVQQDRNKNDQDV